MHEALLATAIEGTSLPHLWEQLKKTRLKIFLLEIFSLEDTARATYRFKRLEKSRRAGSSA